MRRDRASSLGKGQRSFKRCARDIDHTSFECAGRRKIERKLFHATAVRISTRLAIEGAEETGALLPQPLKTPTLVGSQDRIERVAPGASLRRELEHAHLQPVARK